MHLMKWLYVWHPKEFDYFGNVEWFHKNVHFCVTFVENNKYFLRVTINSSLDITMTFVLAYNFKIYLNFHNHCYNLSLGLTTKARAYKSAGQK